MAKTQRASKSTCKGCGEKFPTDTMKVISGKKYCPRCAEPLLRDSEDYKTLCKYIYEFIYDKNCNMPLITTQIRKLKDEYGDITNRRMYLTLKYAIEVEEVDIEGLDPEWGVYNLIVRWYFTSKKFYALKERINKDVAEIKDALTCPSQDIILKRSDLNRKAQEDAEKKRIQEHKVILSDECIEDDESEDIDFKKEFGNLMGYDKEARLKQYKIRYDKLKKFKT